MGVRETRLLAEFNEIQAFRSAVLKLQLAEGTPPSHYLFWFNLRSIISFDAAGAPVYHTGFEVEFVYPAEFPRKGPEVRFIKKPWPVHPNVFQSGRICLEGGQNWIPGVGVPLTSMVYMVGQIIAFQEVNRMSPANNNTVLDMWIQQNLRFATRTRVLNPVDNAPIRLVDLSDAIAWGERPKPRIDFD